MSVSINGTGGITFADTSTQSTGGYTGFRNRIINGAMMIDQRNAGAAVTITSGANYIFAVDRFGNYNNTGTNYTAEQVEDAPAGFYQSTKLTFGSAISLTSQNEATFFQIIEGLNVTDFGWGTANAQTITVGKWVKASFTGIFSIGFCNDTGIRSYATTYTINAANTWEYKTFTIPGDTAGTWSKNNGGGLYVRWNIVAGSNFQVTANNTWTARTGAFNAADGVYGTKAIGSATSISAGSTWQITGVQLEKGSVATPFEFRPYGTEWALCQRYFQQIGSGMVGIEESATTISYGIKLTEIMRASPTLTPIKSLYTARYISGAEVGDRGVNYSIHGATTISNQGIWLYLNDTNSGSVIGRTSIERYGSNIINASAEL